MHKWDAMAIKWDLMASVYSSSTALVVGCFICVFGCSCTLESFSRLESTEFSVRALLKLVRCAHIQAYCFAEHIFETLNELASDVVS